MIVVSQLASNAMKLKVMRIQPGAEWKCASLRITQPAMPPIKANNCAHAQKDLIPYLVKLNEEQLNTISSFKNYFETLLDEKN